MTSDRIHSELADRKHRELRVLENGEMVDGAICPECHQARSSAYFYSKKDKKTMAICRNCRRKKGNWSGISPS